ncbi:MAG TPA: molybdopterin molybdotransferase MoeA [Cytophagaceae bacterium]|nr:molybdopterin molybdotransferase MoeA [Cytophagaceae bacterium]
MITVQQAQALILQQAHSFGTEEILLGDAYQRVLAIAVEADRDYPPFHRAAMDGYALRSEDFDKGIRSFTVAEEIFAGALSAKKIKQGECYKIMTGASTPLEADAIIRVEDATQINDTVVFQIDSLKKGQNIAAKGEDRKKGELVLEENTLLTAPELAALAVLGKDKVNVYKLPKVAIISTGDEVVSLGNEVLEHQIRDSNSYAVEGFLMKYNIPLAARILVKDNKQLLQQAIEAQLSADILILSGGVSMGDADFVPEILQQAGVEKLFHKVAIKPGKPLWFGRSKRGVVFALPGNPMSVQVAFKLFIEPFLRQCYGLPALPEWRLPLAVAKKKKVKLDEYFPCILESQQMTSLKPATFNGSGDVTSILYSQGLALHESEREAIQAGEIVKFWLW